MSNINIKNVIYFYPGDEPKPIEEVKKKKQEDWCYSDYLTDACAHNKYNLVKIFKYNVSYVLHGDIININDTNTGISISLTKDNVKDTVIFQGQSNDDINSGYITLLNTLENYGFLLFNTINEIEMASNKIFSANLLKIYNVPQPNYIYVNKNTIINYDTGEINKSFFDLLKTLYDNNVSINSEQQKTQYVVKTLRGSLGIGVFICYEEELLSILQTIFKLNENAELMIQEFCENDGDIRVHAFSLDCKNYEILGVMKRNQIKGDFRSNVSLGATTNDYDLTDKQRELIINAAKATQCKWVGIDLLHTKDDRDLIIEYNSSPGVEGISQQLKQNMFNIIFDKIREFNGHAEETQPETDGPTVDMPDESSSIVYDNIIKEVNYELEEMITEDINMDGVSTYKNENYFIKNIVLIAKSTDIKTNDGAAYVNAVCEKNGMNAYCFKAMDTDCETVEDGVRIFDENNEVTLTKENVKDTIVITRSSIIYYELAIKTCLKLESMGFIVFNPIDTCLTANNKLKMCELFKSYNIPSPRFVWVNWHDVRNGKDALDEKLKEIYEKPNDKSKYVCKILDGHGGKGVFKCDGSTIFGILQTIFHLDKEHKIVIQEFCDCDGGDFRVHVLTTKNGQKIMAAMKRDQLTNDFRSNVSLGASTELVDLTQEQKEIAYRVASISKMPWCAVDIMPLKKPSKEKFNNVVLEFNDSPGLGGISHILKKNMINILLDNLDKNDFGIE